jgi:uncharacterized protein
MAKNGQCRKCTGLCCRYFALPLDTPKEKEDFDDIRWYLCHKDVTVFVDDGDWYLNLKNKCRHISEKDHRCRIYETRPKICRKYRYADCDYTDGQYDYELHFTDDKQMQEYIKIKFGNNLTEKPCTRRGTGKRKVRKTGKKINK